MISVIIPVYNVEKYLRKCLESVINQTYKDIEIVCVNDGSTDGSLAILNEYAQKDDRIKVINKNNGGLSSARNSGLDSANGEYCYFVDSDDWIELNTLEKLVNIIEKNDVETVVHSIVNIPENNLCIGMSNSVQRWFDKKIKPNGVYNIPIEINKDIPSIAWNKLYKMNIINKYHCRFPEGLINEDELFLWTYMIHCKKYYFLNEVLYNYFRRTDSIMGTRDNSPKILDILDIQEKIYEAVKRYKNIEDYQDYLTTNYVKVVKSLYNRMPRKYRKAAYKKIKEYYENTNHDKRILKLYKDYKYKNLKQFIQGIFSVTNEDHHKIVRILGIKIKFNKNNIDKLIYIYILNKIKLPSKRNKSQYKNKFLLFRYDYLHLSNKYGVNLGDYIQTIATKRVIEKINNANFIYWDRDNLLNYKGSKVYTIMQGWFSHSSTYLTNKNILPIYIGTHITSVNGKRKEFEKFIKHNPEYFKNITFGCRDTSTLQFMRKSGLSSYLSRCLTLTLPKRLPSENQKIIYIVDIPEKMLEYIPQELRENAIYVRQRSIDKNKETSFYINAEEKYIKRASKLLLEYSNNAKLVITSALHCASPCLAMGIPTILIDFEEKNDRFGSLKGILKIYSKKELIDGSINYNPSELDIEDLKQLMIKNVELSIKQAFDEEIDINELNNLRKRIENYNILE